MTQKLRVKCLNRKSTIMKMIITKAFRDSAQCASFSGSSLSRFGSLLIKVHDRTYGTTDGGGTSGTLYIILALCMLVSSLLYFIMQKSNTIFAFLLPMLFYLGAAYLLLKRGDDIALLIAAIVSGVLAIISLILAITSRGGSDYDDSEENYDEAFEDDYAEEEFDD